MRSAVRCAMVLSVCLGALAGCSSSDKGESVVAVNKTCPVEGAPVKANVTESYQGKTVGFCCTTCEGKWTAMTDAQRAEAFKKATAAK